jgi:hypothetical protein
MQFAPVPNRSVPENISPPFDRTTNSAPTPSKIDIGIQNAEKSSRKKFS